jgi:pentatricopeptide repeat protein
MSSDKMDSKFFKATLHIAEKMRDPQIAADIICGANIGQDYEAHGSKSVDSISNQRIPPSVYMQAIRLCVDCGLPSLGDRILSNASQNNPKMPSRALGDMHTLVLTGYAQSGDTEKAGHVFNQMKMSHLTLR